jgi:hypothetical protein
MLITNEYKNTGTSMTWQCENGHQWNAAFGSMKHRNSWCPKCARVGAVAKRTINISEPRSYAASRKGKLLSPTYVSGKTKMLWECEHGHRWDGAYVEMKLRGYWCPKCSGRRQRRTIEDAQEIANSKGGVCLSTEIVNVTTKLKWQCQYGHNFEMILNSITSQNQWCPECSGRKRKTIEHCQILAKKFGGRCISTTYHGNKVPLEWECKFGHRWKARPNSVTNGYWCNVCSAGIGERICKIFFDTLFDDNFVKVKPAWLMGPNGHPLELDGYSEKLRLAFEHQGQQHYKDVSKFTSKYDVSVRRGLDAYKIETCLARGITLIEIPEIPTMTALEDIKAVIKRSCEASGYPLPENFDETKVDYLPAYQDNRFEEFNLIAAEKGGLCHVELGYVDNGKLEWECKYGHVWRATSKWVKKGTWCPECAGNKPMTIDDFVSIAKAKGGLCLTTEYTNSSTPITFRCAVGHEFTLIANHVVNSDSWCRVCNKNQANQKIISNLNSIAESRGGRLVDLIVRPGGRYTWECADGHQWDTTDAIIKRGSWCPECIGRAKRSIDEIRLYASSKHGSLITDKYVSSTKKMTWECAQGHQWEASYSSVIDRGTWCLDCLHAQKREVASSYAKVHGGRLMSNTYTDGVTKIRWECAEGHQWEAGFNAMKHRNGWCPSCAGTQKMDIEQAQSYAISKHGKLLSDVYVNGATKMLWECSKGHRWEAGFGSMKNQRSWCLICAGKQKKDISELRQYALEREGRLLSDEYINGNTAVRWECAEGHQWESGFAMMNSRKSWCAICANRSRRAIPAH